MGQNKMFSVQKKGLSTLLALTRNSPETGDKNIKKRGCCRDCAPPKIKEFHPKSGLGRG
jgi:hypothetical protein